jgi:hypothetical protein
MPTNVAGQTIPYITIFLRKWQISLQKLIFINLCVFLVTILFVSFLVLCILDDSFHDRSFDAFPTRRIMDQAVEQERQILDTRLLVYIGYHFSQCWKYRHVHIYRGRLSSLHHTRNYRFFTVKLLYIILISFFRFDIDDSVYFVNPIRSYGDLFPGVIQVLQTHTSSLV